MCQRAVLSGEVVSGRQALADIVGWGTFGVMLGSVCGTDQSTDLATMPAAQAVDGIAEMVSTEDRT